MQKVYLNLLFFIKNRLQILKLGFSANVQIYSNFHEFMKEYSNIFGFPKIYELISEYIRTGEIGQIRIRLIFEGHFIRILEYLNIRIFVLITETNKPCCSEFHPLQD